MKETNSASDQILFTSVVSQVLIVGYRKIRWCYFSKMDILMIGKDRIMP